MIVRDTEEEAQAELARVLDVRADPAAYASYQDFVAGSQLESQVSLEEYSVSNRGLRAGLVGTPAQVRDRLKAYEDGRRRPGAAAVQPAARGDGALRRAGHRPLLTGLARRAADPHRAQARRAARQRQHVLERPAPARRPGR